MLHVMLIFIGLSPDAFAVETAECRAGSPAVSQVRAVAAGIIAADNDRNLARVLSFYATDAILMPPNEAAVRGRDAIRPRYEGLFSAFDPEIEGRIDEACVTGPIAVIRGSNAGRLRGRGQQSSRTLNDVYIMLLRLDADGSWRISHLMWHAASLPERDAR